MARDEDYVEDYLLDAFQRAERKIEKARQSGVPALDLSGHWVEEEEESPKLTELPESLGQLTNLWELDLSNNRLTVLPESLGQLTQLQWLDLSRNSLAVLPKELGRLTQLRSLNLSRNRLTSLPKWLSRLTKLQDLRLFDNRLVALPDWLYQLTQLRKLSLSGNRLTVLPKSLCQLTQLQTLYLYRNQLTELPKWFGRLTQLQELNLSANHLTSLPESFSQLENLWELNLNDNPLDPELAAAYKEGLDAVKRYLRTKAEAQVVLNEAKLILIGEGEVGKSCLLAALRGDPWEEGRPKTHGIEIKPVKVIDPASGKEIMLNGWDFGGQRVYRPTHQLFFSAPAVYLVVWKPREGPSQGFVKEWINLVKHREPDAKILVVATHGGPKERQPDIDRQEIWDLFGKETVIDFFLVESKPPTYDKKTKTWLGERAGIKDLKDAIARVAASLPEMGRTVPKRWDEARTTLKKTGAAYLPLEQVLRLCHDRKMDEEEAKDFIRVSHRLGHLIHYEHDPALRDIVILKPDWLSTAMSYVLDDKQTREGHGLVSFARLGQLWNDPKKPEENRYPAKLHPIFLRLMERFDLSYRVAEPHKTQSDGTSLIAQLVPDVRPDPIPGWAASAAMCDEQQVQICRIVETKTGQSATAEGLFYQLIVRLHKHSLGRANYKESVHWQRGLVLDDDYNGRALLEHVGNDVRITVRAPYPQAFLAVLTHEVKWLVESFWASLRCDVMVPCIEPCGRNEPGTGLFEVQKLIESKRRGRPEYPCPVCDEWQNIDCLLLNAPAARPAPLEELLAEFATVKEELAGARRQLIALRGEAMGRFDQLDIGTQRILSRVDDAFAGLMQTLTDEAKEGPRLFSFEPVDPGFFDRPKWVSAKFRVTLWCEHSRLPLPALNGKGDKRGVYELTLPRDWFVKAAPFLKLLAGTLSLVLPVASSATKLVLDEAAYKGIEEQLDLGQKSLDAVLDGGEKAGAWLGKSDTPDLERGEMIEARGAVLRQLQVWLKEKDPGFGGLVRVQNKRQEFLWVHPQFVSEY
ncbi:MAG: hypothetical protein C4523_20060 [Myxococcales bacterium]|nr:MAG: hypothetical protein C4523_20060 [Myxococcales bacterium]